MKDSYGREWVRDEDGWYTPVPSRTPASDAEAWRRRAEWEAQQQAKAKTKEDAT